MKHLVESYTISYCDLQIPWIRLELQTPLFKPNSFFKDLHTILKVHFLIKKKKGGGGVRAWQKYQEMLQLSLVIKRNQTWCPDKFIWHLLVEKQQIVI